MVQVVSDTVEEGKDNLVPGIAGAAGMGIGTMFLGPGLGVPIGATAAGAYVGGTAGTALSVVGIALGLSTLIFGGPLGGAGMGSSGNSGGSRRRL